MSASSTTMQFSRLRMRPLIGKVVLAPVAYFAMAAIAAYLWPRNPSVAIAASFAAALVIAAAFKRSRGFLLWQLEKSRTTFGLILASIVAGGAFYVAAFILQELDTSRILGWRLSAGYLLLTAIALPFIEEFLFRGVAIGTATGQEALIAAVLSAICFAAFHPDRWLGTFVFSLVAAGFYMRGGLASAWGFHAAYNLSNYAMLVFLSARNA